MYQSVATYVRIRIKQFKKFEMKIRIKVRILSKLVENTKTDIRDEFLDTN